MHRREWLDKYRLQHLDHPATAPGMKSDKIQDYILRMMGFLEESSIVADFGCGVYDSWELMRDMSLRIVGVSCNRKEQQKMGIRIMNIELADFNFLGIFEGFAAVGLLQLIQPELWSKVLLKISRSVKTNSVGLVVTGLSLEEEARSVYNSLRSSGLPVVVGEYLEGEDYQFKPLKCWYDQWLKTAGFSVLREEVIDSVVYSLVRK